MKSWFAPTDNRRSFTVPAYRKAEKCLWECRPTEELPDVTCQHQRHPMKGGMSDILSKWIETSLRQREKKNRLFSANLCVYLSTQGHVSVFKCTDWVWYVCPVLVGDNVYFMDNTSVRACVCVWGPIGDPSLSPVAMAQRLKSLEITFMWSDFLHRWRQCNPTLYLRGNSNLSEACINGT